MKKYYSILIMLVSLEVFIWSCNSNNKPNGFKTNDSKNKADTVLKEIPLTKQGRLSAGYIAAKRLAFALSLDSLELGYDSLQIRIIYPNLTKRYIVVLKKRKNEWNADLYTLSYEYDPKTEGYIMTNKEIRKVSPKSDWEIFSNKLFELKIMTLPDNDDIPGYKLGLDGCSYDVEVATQNKYRFYGYWEPEANQDKHWEANNILKILDLVEAEFGFKRVLCK